MERDELEKRYKQAQLHAMAKAAEQQPAEDPQQDNSESTTPTLAQIMGVKPQQDEGRYLSENDRLRRYCGLK